MKKMLSTKEVARYLDVNEKMVYTLVAEKRLPASKVTGKWLFPQHLVDQWVEANTQNFPSSNFCASTTDGLLVLAGSNDLLLEQTINLYNANTSGKMAVFGNLGSMGGIRALKQGLCHVATSHLLQVENDEYNFEYISQDFLPPPVVVNFCCRRQGLVLAAGNPKNIHQTKDLNQPGLRVVNRKLGTGTRLLFDREIKAAGLQSQKLEGFDNEVARHMDVGLAILSGKADVGPCIEPVADLLGIDFLPWRWERYDLLILKERFFEPQVQRFLNLLHDSDFQGFSNEFRGYDLSSSGKMIFPAD